MQTQLNERGFRFIYRSGTYKWVHPAEVTKTDADLTTWDDASFEAFVVHHAGSHQ